MHFWKQAKSLTKLTFYKSDLLSDHKVKILISADLEESD